MSAHWLILFHSSGFALASQRSDSIDSVSPSHIAKELWVRCQGYVQDGAVPTAERPEEWLALGGETGESGKILGMPWENPGLRTPTI
jgi:hypothetical protein